MGATRLGAAQLPPMLPPSKLDFNGLAWIALDAKKAGSLDFTGLTGLLWTCLELQLVEVAGIEPASVSPLPLVLHA